MSPIFKGVVNSLIYNDKGDDNTLDNGDSPKDMGELP
jgi:hypothetical protein